MSATYADYRHHSSALLAFFAITKEQVGTARGAQVADEDIVRVKSRREELCPIGFPQIE